LDSIEQAPARQAGRSAMVEMMRRQRVTWKAGTVEQQNAKPGAGEQQSRRRTSTACSDQDGIKHSVSLLKLFTTTTRDPVDDWLTDRFAFFSDVNQTGRRHKVQTRMPVLLATRKS
jgi:hypothetical protein